MSKTQIALIAATLTLSFVAFAADEKKDVKKAGEGAVMQAPTPSKELESFMKPVEGSWTCDTKMMAGAMGPSSPEITGKSKVKFSKDKETNGLWYRGEYSMPKSTNHPGMTGYFLFSHDDTNKMLTQISWDNMGGASMGTGSISGESMTWTGEGVNIGQKMKTRDTMTKTSAKTITHKFEADMGKGWQVMGEDSCTKGPGTT